MNFSDFITDHGKRVMKEHFIHLIQVSQIDGKISHSERICSISKAKNSG